jgi:hypothetical protein
MTEWQERFVAFLVGLGLVALTAVIAGI